MVQDPLGHERRGGQQERREGKLNKYEAEFLDVDQDFLFHLIMAANYLNIENLLDKSCEKVANMIKGKYTQRNT